MRKAIFPDSNDRTPNDPAILLSWASVQRIYEAEFGAVTDGGPKRTDKDICNFMAIKAREYGWDHVELIGRQVLLKKTLPLRILGTSD